MPKKSRRVAARQAQLSQRKKRTRPHGPSAPEQHRQKLAAGDGSPATVEHPLPGERLAVPSPELEPTEESPPESLPVTEMATKALQAEPRLQAPPLRRRRSQPRIEAARYLKQEMIRIGVTSALIFGILAVLTVLLR